MRKKFYGENSNNSKIAATLYNLAVTYNHLNIERNVIQCLKQALAIYKIVTPNNKKILNIQGYLQEHGVSDE